MACNDSDSQEQECYFILHDAQPPQAHSTAIIRSVTDLRFQWHTVPTHSPMPIDLEQRAHINKIDIGISATSSGAYWAALLSTFPHLENVKFTWRPCADDEEDTRTRRLAAQSFFDTVLQTLSATSVRRLCLHGFAMAYELVERVFAYCASTNRELELEQITLVQAVGSTDIGVEKDLSRTVGCEIVERGWVRFVQDMRVRYPGMAERKALQLGSLREFYASRAGRRGVYFDLDRGDGQTVRMLQDLFEEGVWGRDLMDCLYGGWCDEGYESLYHDQWGY
ncbi:hypothetical protein P153DRAFT_385042 [Dothidotthia symphoricarpi CBS 119687]|uniref:Uncharacterized protein n=1 Tax=Dothidotthia symphoricarpi CBS 119687 TaxID=1392245 RepID=A0A6A6AH88_9PLEO|nr:uncharacterized protein P153DRAFT_385042 [Dothidotthia symphoricarpi CBS 119687]KAF2129811.1 hypothetical protein P153DRAFT_385042 [Dothidotthia symphoricarpi CBS 119687]